MTQAIRLVCVLSLLLLPALAAPAVVDGQETGGQLVFEEDFENGADRWETTDDSNWALHENDGGKAYGLVRRYSDYKPKYRSPYSIALVNDVEVADFVLTLQVKSTLDTGGHRDCCLFFNHQDPEHFYYVHLGARPDPRSGQIMIVNGAARKALTTNTNPTPWDDNWHDVKIVRDTQEGTIAIYFDNMQEPHMQVVDKTFGKGRLGIGSFDDMNDFDNVKIYNTAGDN